MSVHERGSESPPGGPPVRGRVWAVFPQTGCLRKGLLQRGCKLRCEGFALGETMVFKLPASTSVLVYSWRKGEKEKGKHKGCSSEIPKKNKKFNR